MVRSLYSGVSGLSSNQFKMDVIGNNLANVNTIGYKSRRGHIASAFAQVSRAASSLQPTGIEVGLGAQVASTDAQFTQGPFQRTDVPTDIGLAGDGFMMLGSTAAATTPVLYSRNGNFNVDLNGFLRTQDGFFVLGTLGDAGSQGSGFSASVAANVSSAVLYATATAATGLSAIRIPTTITGGAPSPQSVASFSVGSDGKIVVTGDSGASSAIGFLSVATFSSNQGLSSAPNTNYTSSDASGAATANPPGTSKAGKTQAGVLELSNVDIATEFSNMIVTQRGFDVNARTITATDEMLQTVVNIKR